MCISVYIYIFLYIFISISSISISIIYLCHLIYLYLYSSALINLSALVYASKISKLDYSTNFLFNLSASILDFLDHAGARVP